jgi:hypothetical protein
MTAAAYDCLISLCLQGQSQGGVWFIGFSRLRLAVTTKENSTNPKEENRTTTERSEMAEQLFINNEANKQDGRRF